MVDQLSIDTLLSDLLCNELVTGLGIKNVDVVWNPDQTLDEEAFAIQTQLLLSKHDSLALDVWLFQKVSRTDLQFLIHSFTNVQP